MSSSEPRLTPSPATGSARELTGDEANPLRSNVPFTTHVLLVGSMLLFFLAATLITLQAAVEWWIIPALIAVPVVLILTQRYQKVRRARDAARAMEAEWQAARDEANRPGSTR